MDGKAAPTAAAPGSKGSPDDDADGMRTIIEAAIGLTSLGAPAPGPLAHPSANENAGDDAATAAPGRRTGPAAEEDPGTATTATERRRREPPEPASDGRGPPPPSTSILTKGAHVPIATGLPLATTKNEKLKMTTTPPERRKPTTDATESMVAMMSAPVAAKAKARPAPSPASNDRLPRLFVPPHAAKGSSAMSQRGRTNSISFPPALAPQNPHFDPTASALGPMSYLPPGVADQNRLGLPPKRQRVDHQSWKTPWEQQQQVLQQAQRHQAQQRREQGPREVSIWSRKQGYPSLVRAMAAADDAGSGAAPLAAAAAPPPGSVTLNFPEILYEVLSDPANGDILAWLPHGRGFVIHDRNLFASEILPRKFDGAKFTSFTRRLKRWKFQRVPRGPEMGAYYNKYFVRDRPDLVSGMMYGMDEAEGEQGAADAGEQGAVLAGQPPEAAGRLSGKAPETDKPQGGEDGDKKERKINKEEDGVATTAMELYRQQQRMKRRLKRDIDEEMVMRIEEWGRGEKPRGGALAAAGEELRRQHEWVRWQLETKDDRGHGGPGEEGVKEEQKEKKKEETEVEEDRKSEAVTSFGAAYDDAVVEAAMEAHRQRQQRHQQQLSTIASDDEMFQERKTIVDQQEDTWLLRQKREPRLLPPTPRHHRSRSSSEVLYPGYSNLGQRPHIEKSSKKEETRNEKKCERSQKSAVALRFGVAYDDAVVEAAMNARRQKLQQQELQQPPTKEPHNENYREKISGSSYQDTWLPPQNQEPIPPLAASRRSSSKIPSPASRNPDKDFNPPINHVDQFHHRQQQQLELLRRWPSKDSLSSSKSKQKQRQYQKPPNGSLHTSQPGYSRDSKKEGKKRSHQQQHKQHQSPPSATSSSSRSIPEELQTQLRNNLRTPYNSPYNPPYNPQEWQHQPWCQPQGIVGLEQESPGPNPSRPRERGPGTGPAAPYNPEDYLSISEARREARAATSMPANGDVSAARRGVGVPEAAPPSIGGSAARDGSEQQQYLKDIERQILSEISEYPLLRSASLSAPFSTRDYPRGELGGAVHGPIMAGGYFRKLSGEPFGMACHGNGMNTAIVEQDRMVDRAFADARMQPGNIQGLFAGQDINEKILASSITHKQIMMMAARDLQSRGMGRQLGAAAALERHRPPPQEPPRQQPPLRREYLQAQQLQRLSQALYPRTQGPPMPSAGMPSQQELSQPPRAGYTSSHAMMLRELEEKVERETLAAESAAAGLREREKRRGSGASAA